MNEAAADELQATQSAWRALRNRWKLDDREAFAILQCDGNARVLTAVAESRMRILLEIGSRLDSRAGERALCERLRHPIPRFNQLSPLQAMSGGIGELRAIRAAVEAGEWS